MVNLQILVGRMGKNPELKALEGGNSMVKFTVATNDGYYDKEHKWIESTEWHNCIAFGKIADSIGKRFERGFLVYIEGKTMHRAIIKDGEDTKYFTQVKVSTIRKAQGGTTRVQEGNKEADKLAEENGFAVETPISEIDLSADLPKEAKTDDLPF